MLKRAIEFILLTGLVLPSARIAWSQIVSGTISGTVMDSSNAAILDAKVTVVNQDTGLTRDSMSRDVWTCGPNLCTGLEKPE